MLDYCNALLGRLPDDCSVQYTRLLQYPNRRHTRLLQCLIIGCISDYCNALIGSIPEYCNSLIVRISDHCNTLRGSIPHYCNVLSRRMSDVCIALLGPPHAPAATTIRLQHFPNNYKPSSVKRGSSAYYEIK